MKLWSWVLVALLALASFERTLVSSLTRFDAWVAGDEAALARVKGDLARELAASGFPVEGL